MRVSWSDAVASCAFTVAAICDQSSKKAAVGRPWLSIKTCAGSGSGILVNFNVPVAVDKEIARIGHADPACELLELA